MEQAEFKKKKAKFITPPNRIKQKVGSGGVANEVIDKADEYIEQLDFDFRPYAEKFLKDFSSAIVEYEEANDKAAAKERITTPIMELKASARTFHYPLLSDVAEIGLQFLDSTEEINEDLMQVLVAHQVSIQGILRNNLKGDAGQGGEAIIQELEDACKRYFKKYKRSKTA